MKKRFLEKDFARGMNFYSLVFWLCFLICIMTVIGSCFDRFDRLFPPEKIEAIR